MIQERLRRLRQEMKKENIQAYIIPTSDFHQTEYVADYFACRKYMSGFTGSAGTLVVLEDQAALWTDGRYFVQAENELQDSTIDLMKMGIEGTPSIGQYICERLQAEDCVGFDGRVINTFDAKRYKNAFVMQRISMRTEMDLVGRIWDSRPSLPCSETFYFDEKYAGLSVKDKLEQLRKKMKESYASAHIITKIDEIAWLFNMRAHDIPHFPVALAYAIVTMENATLYIDESRLDAKTFKELTKNHVRIAEYNDIYQDVKMLRGSILLDPTSVNWLIYESIHTNIIEKEDPILLLKAKKNPIELENTRRAHIKDGVALTKFMYWLERNVSSQTISEISAQEKLQDFRKEQADYIEDSFGTISAYKEHAAMMHYSASKETDVVLKQEGMLLVDSGAHYLDGTTDTTRTFVLGDITEEEKYWFTLALRGHIRLAKSTFLYGCRGINLDILARGPLWDQYMDYQCGTGHGVGHVLSVHEGPNGFRWRQVPERNDSCILEVGMLQSDEPGVYEPGKFGIRHENELVVQSSEKNFYGQFLNFETLTFVPFDKKGIDASIMTFDEIEWLNEYHRSVYDKISLYLSKEESDWLRDVCSPIVV